jgi:hypothetical protein
VGREFQRKAIPSDVREYVYPSGHLIFLFAVVVMMLHVFLARCKGTSSKNLYRCGELGR